MTGIAPAGARVVQDISMAADQDTIVDAAGTWSLIVKLKQGSNTLKFRLGDDDASVITLGLTYSPAAVATPAATTAPRPTPAQTAEPGKTAAPKPTANPADDIGLVIPGLAVVDVTLNLKPRGFECSGPVAGVDLSYWTCTKDTPTSSINVEVYAETPSSVRNVTSTVLWYGSGSGDETFDAFLGYIATLRYEGSKPTKAKAWVTSRSKGTTNFGPARYQLTTASTKRARILEITGNGK
ncbi:MAG TPA: hypothetical protein VGK53_12475 [Propionicimonas sp.]